MPIYEFYCRSCNVIFSFFSRRINTATIPLCPRCKKVKLSREVSAFASVGRHKEGVDGGDGGLGADSAIDEPQMEKVMESLASEAAGMDDADPRQAANLMRKFTAATGMKMGEGMEEAVRRLEAGEDPETVEAEMGDRLEKEDPLAPAASKGKTRKKAGPGRDKKLYDM